MMADDLAQRQARAIVADRDEWEPVFFQHVFAGGDAKQLRCETCGKKTAHFYEAEVQYAEGYKVTTYHCCVWQCEGRRAFVSSCQPWSPSEGHPEFGFTHKRRFS